MRSVRLVEIMGLEPTTYGLQSRRSSQLSYIPSSIRSPNKKDGIELGSLGIAAFAGPLSRLGAAGCLRIPRTVIAFRLFGP